MTQREGRDGGDAAAVSRGRDEKNNPNLHLIATEKQTSSTARRGVFGTWQPCYAEHRVATFPVATENKKPAIKGYQRVGLGGSARLAFKFTDADAFGFICGPRSRITVLD